MIFLKIKWIERRKICKDIMLLKEGGLLYGNLLIMLVDFRKICFISRMQTIDYMDN